MGLGGSIIFPNKVVDDHRSDRPSVVDSQGMSSTESTSLNELSSIVEKDAIGHRLLTNYTVTFPGEVETC